MAKASYLLPFQLNFNQTSGIHCKSNQIKASVVIIRYNTVYYTVAIINFEVPSTLGTTLSWWIFHFSSPFILFQRLTWLW